MRHITSILGSIALACLGFGVVMPNIEAAAQGTCPTFRYGLVLTAAQWQACFDAKVSAAGGTLSGGTIIGGSISGASVTFSGPVQLPSLTTTERDAIASPVNGMLIYNSTVPAVQARVNGAWVGL